MPHPLLAEAKPAAQPYLDHLPLRGRCLNLVAPNPGSRSLFGQPLGFLPVALFNPLILFRAAKIIAVPQKVVKLGKRRMQYDLRICFVHATPARNDREADRGDFAGCALSISSARSSALSVFVLN
jgi:hypothetical protein